MAIKTVTMSVSGPTEIIDAAIGAYARAYGWTATVDDGQGGTIANPVSAEQFARTPILTYLREVSEAQLLRESLAATAEAVQANLAIKSPQIDLTVEV